MGQGKTRQSQIFEVFILFLVAPAAESRATYLLCMVSGWLVVCLLVDRELNFKY